MTFISFRETAPQYEPPRDWRKFVKITDAEARKCLEALQHRYPTLLPSVQYGQVVPLAQLVEPLRVAVTALETCFKRLDKPDHRRLVGDWCDKVERAAKSIGAPTALVNELTFPACIILDVPFTLYADGHIPSLGISEYMGQPFTPTYQHVVKGKLRQPGNFALAVEKPTRFNEDRFGHQNGEDEDPLWKRETTVWQKGW
jgi:hypothetical protein